MKRKNNKRRGFREREHGDNATKKQRLTWSEKNGKILVIKKEITKVVSGKHKMAIMVTGCERE